MFAHHIKNGRYYCPIKDRNTERDPHYYMTGVVLRSNLCAWCGKALKQKG